MTDKSDITIQIENDLASALQSGAPVGPWDPMPGLVQLRIMICVNCWDGTIRFPLIRKRAWVDQGIDLFPDQKFVEERHICLFTALRAAARAGSEDAVRRWAMDTNRVSGRRQGRWEERALNITPEMRDGLIQYLEQILKGPAA